MLNWTKQLISTRQSFGQGSNLNFIDTRNILNDYLRIQTPGKHVDRPEIREEMSPVKWFEGVITSSPLNGPNAAILPGVVEKGMDETRFFLS